MTISSGGYCLVSYSQQFALYIGNLFAVCAAFAVLLLIRSWNTPVTRTYLSGVGFTLAIFAIAFLWLLVQQSSFSSRVYVAIGFYILPVLLALFELLKITKKENSFHLKMLICILLIELTLSVFRLYSIENFPSTGYSIFQEDARTTILRLLLISSSILVYVAIGNLQYERLWKKEEKRTLFAEDQMLATLNSLALARDDVTGNHIMRTQAYVRVLASCLRQASAYSEHLTDDDIDLMFRAAPLHDIGKVGIPDKILLKPGPLSETEWEIMKSHTRIGEDVLSATRNATDYKNLIIVKAIEIAGGHHERWDGRGYPRGLAGETIPLSARIMAIADVYDALVSPRHYKKKWTHDEALAEIVSESGSHFDPLVVKAFIISANSFKEISAKLND